MPRKKQTTKSKAAEASNEEKIGWHKGALTTLINERKELTRILQITNSLMEVHVKALKELGVDLQKEAQQQTAAKK